MASGHETATDVALATAVRTDTWIIIENIHFASVAWLKQLYIRLARLRNQAGESHVSETEPLSVLFLYVKATVN